MALFHTHIGKKENKTNMIILWGNENSCITLVVQLLGRQISQQAVTLKAGIANHLEIPFPEALTHLHKDVQHSWNIRNDPHVTQGQSG